jgi:hypothetical protein
MHLCGGLGLINEPITSCNNKLDPACENDEKGDSLVHQNLKDLSMWLITMLVQILSKTPKNPKNKAHKNI